MVGIGCIVAVALVFAGAIAGVMIGGTAAGLWGGAAGLVLGVVVMLLTLWLLDKTKGGIPE